MLYGFKQVYALGKYGLKGFGFCGFRFGAIRILHFGAYRFRFWGNTGDIVLFKDKGFLSLERFGLKVLGCPLKSALQTFKGL